eukprot:scaffold1399_cov410-Prasinococcus_capsulatus_cf.AAC.25
MRGRLSTVGAPRSGGLAVSYMHALPAAWQRHIRRGCGGEEELAMYWRVATKSGGCETAREGL